MRMPPDDLAFAIITVRCSDHAAKRLVRPKPNPSPSNTLDGALRWSVTRLACEMKPARKPLIVARWILSQLGR